jgi:hypothetical protein
MRFIEIPALITEDIEDPSIVDITEEISVSISGTTMTIDGGSKVSGEATVTLTGDTTVNAFTLQNIRTPSLHKISVKTGRKGNFTYVPNDTVTASSVSTTTKTGSDFEILLITTNGGETYVDFDMADYTSPALYTSNALTGFDISELTSTYGATAKLYKPDGTLLTTVNSATTGGGIGFGSGVESIPGDVTYTLEVTDDLGRTSRYDLPRKWINYAMGTTSTPGFQKFRLEGIDDDYTTTVMFPSLGSSSTAKVYRTSDHGYLGINFKIQGRNSTGDDWVDIANADEDDEVLAFGDFLYHRVWVKPTAKATTTVSSSNVVTLTLSNLTEENVTTSFTGADPYDINESTNTYVFEETTKIGTVPFTVTLGGETYTNAVSATTEGTAYDYVTLAFANPTLSLTTSNVTISSAKLYKDDVLFHTYGTESNVVLRSDQTGTYQAVVNDVYYSNRVVPDFTTTRSVSAPQLEFDGYNRLNLSNITPTSTTLGVPDGTTRDLTTQSSMYIYEPGTYTANVQTSETFAYLSNVVTSQPSQNPTDVGPTFTFDEYNRLAIENITQTSSSLRFGSNTYDTNTASNVYVTDTGEYKLEARDANTFVISNVYVDAVDTTTFTLAFHHGAFSTSDYSGVYSTVGEAATAGHVYSDTTAATYTWGTLNSVDTSTSGQTGYSWTPTSTITADVLMVAGGGGGGGANGGGGGAGGLVYNSGISLSGAKTIVVGAGGTKGINWNTSGTNATRGNNTSFTDLETAIGGGAGSTYINNPDIGSNDDGGSGGGGGGSSETSSYIDGGSGTSGQGNGGGRGIRYAGGGGGGAGGSGSDGSSPQTGGAGGAGLNYTTTFGTTYGDSGWFAGGGGGGQGGGQGGQGGGGDGGMLNTDPGYNGQSHTGGGGGGGNDTGGGDGGSGIVLIKKLGPINPPALTFDGYNKLTIDNDGNGDTGMKNVTISGGPWDAHTFKPDDNAQKGKFQWDLWANNTNYQIGNKHNLEYVPGYGWYVLNQDGTGFGDVTPTSATSGTYLDGNGVSQTFSTNLASSSGGVLSIAHTAGTMTVNESDFFEGGIFPPKVGSLESVTIKKDGAAFATTTSNTVYIRDTGTYTAEVKGSGAYAIELSKVVGAVSTGVIANPVFTSTTAITTDTNWTSGSGWEVTVDSTNNSTDRPGWKAFDNTWETSNEQNIWHSAETATSTSSPKWLKIKYPSAYKAIQYSIQIRDLSYPRYPKTWKFQGSNNDSDWTDLDTQTNKTDWAGNNTVMFTFSNSTAYQYYRLYITATDTSDNDAGCSIRELKVYTLATGSQVGNVPLPDYTYPNTITVDSALSGTSIIIANDSHQVSGGKWYTLNHSTYIGNRFIFWDNAIGYWSYFDTQGNRPDSSWDNPGGPPGRFFMETDGDLKLFHGSNGSTIMHIKPNSSSNPWPRISTPSLTYDNYNKITLENMNYEDTATVSDPNGSIHEIGTAKTMYVKDTGEYVFKISGTDKYVESNVYVSSVDLAGATTKPIDFDGYNKLTLIDAGSNVSANVTYFSNTYELGSANVLYINGAGTYDLEMSGSNVFALSSNVVNAVDSNPMGTYNSIFNIDGLNSSGKLGASHTGYPISFNAAGTRVVIGEYNSDKAHIYDKVEGSWTLSQTWTKSDGFGKSCAMSDDGNVVVVVENSGTNKLSLFVYENGSWVTKQNQISISGSRDTFGAGLFMSGDGLYLLATDYSYQGSGGRGRNKIYDLSEYSFLERLNFGFSTIASSWHGDIDRYGNRAIWGDGAADYWRVYKRSGATWSQSTTIAPSNTSGKGPASCDENMVRVALSDTGNSSAGVTIWYRNPSGDTFALEKTITVDNSGCNISMNYAGDRLMITDKTAGDIEIWTRSGTTWTKQKTINPPTFGTLVNFAHTANKSDGYTLAITDETYDSNKGRVYIYSDPITPSLTFDNYNKLSIENLTPTSTTLRFGSNTYEIGTASNVYIEDAGTYKVATGDANTFALVSNVVGAIATDKFDPLDPNSVYSILGTAFTPSTTSDTQSTTSLSNDGTRVLVDNETGYFIQVYEYSSGSWTQLGSDINYGTSSTSSRISGDGNRVCVGISSSNQVKVYEYSSGSWSQIGTTITGSNGFGTDTSLNYDGTRLMVGASGDYNTRGNQTVWQESGGNWTQLGSTLYCNHNSYPHSLCGGNVDINNDGTVVCAGGYKGHSQDKGCLHVWKYNGSSWTQSFFSEGGNDHHSNYCRLSGDGKVVMYSHDRWNEPRGRVNFYENTSADTWSQIGGYLEDKKLGDLSNDGKTVVVGKSDASIDSQVYRFDGSAWVQLGSNLEHTSTTLSISSDGSTVAIGNSTSGANKVSVYKGTTPLPSLTYDTSNKLSIANLTPTSTTLTDPNGSSFDIGTASNVYIRDSGKYSIASKDANTFVLASTTVTGTPTGTTYVYDSNTFTTPSQTYDTTKTITVKDIPTDVAGKIYKGSTAYTIHATTSSSNVIIKNTGTYVSVFTTATQAFLTNAIGVTTQPTTTSDDNTIEDEGFIPGSTAVPDETTTDAPSVTLDATDTTVTDPTLDLDFTTTLPRTLKRYNGVTNSSIGARFNRHETNKKRIEKSINTDTFSMELTANNASSPTTLTVTVSNSKFVINDDETPTLGFIRGETYTFDQSDASNSGHPLVLATSADGTQYTTGWTTTPSSDYIPGVSGAQGTFIVPYDVPDTIYYKCTNHAGMGGEIHTTFGNTFSLGEFTVAANTHVSGEYTLATNYDGTTSNLYVNGSLITQTTPSPAISAGVKDFILGKEFDGYVKNFKFWNYAKHFILFTNPNFTGEGVLNSFSGVTLEYVNTTGVYANYIWKTSSGNIVTDSGVKFNVVERRWYDVRTGDETDANNKPYHFEIRQGNASSVDASGGTASNPSGVCINGNLVIFRGINDDNDWLNSIYMSGIV